MDEAQCRNILCKVTPFTYLSNKSLNVLCTQGQLCDYSSTQVMFLESTPCDTLAIVLAGNVRVWKTLFTESHIIADAAFQVIGMYSTWMKLPWSATFVCDPHSKLFFIPTKLVRGFLKDERAFAEHFFLLSLQTEKKYLIKLYDLLSQQMHANIMYNNVNYLNTLFLTVLHDMRAPLSRIACSVQLLPKMGKESEEKIKRVLQAVNEVAYFSQQLLDFSKGKHTISVSISPVLLSVIIKSVVNKFHDVYDTPCHITIVEDCMFMVDRFQIERALLNILDNAHKACKEKGQIIIWAGHDKQQIKIEIQDTGMGMIETEKKKVFQAFYSRLGGHGLGLFSVKNIVDAHGGSIQLSSIPKKGTTITLIFPKTTT